MPLPLPRLDDRTFDQLVAEGQVLLPRAAPGWTDHNVHDPGITLMELLAWLVEMDFYRLDRTPAASRRAFLRLVGIEPCPPRVAESAVVLSVDQPGAAVDLPAGTRVASADENVVFQSAAIRVSPARLLSVLTGAADALADESHANQLHAEPYFAFGRSPRAGHALYIGFDRRLGEESAQISLYMWTGAEETDSETRSRLEADWIAAQEELRKDCPPGFEMDRLDWRQHYSARTIWEYYRGKDIWAPLGDVVDETRAMTLTGPVRFAAPEPQQHAKGGVRAAGQSERYFIRCRLARGGYDCPPAIRLVAINGVEVRHVADVSAAVPLGSSDGSARQVFRLRDAPIVPGSTRVEVALGGVDDGRWNEALVWDRVGPHGRTYVLSPESGEISFGDGRIGRVPPAGARITARYQVGGGAAGNVAAGTLLRIVPTPAARLTVTQPFAAIGGMAREELSDAIRRALALLADRSRAVTLEDFEQLALRAPGTPIVRAHAIADYDADLQCLPAFGCVTVVLVPRCGAPPLPSTDLLREVRRYLDRRRMVTTELRVVAPRYTLVSVRARLFVSDDVAPEKAAEAARAALNQFFDPLKGGPDGNGWPIGRDVYRAEVMALLNRVSGVSHVDEVALRAGDGPFAACGNVAVCRHGLVTAGPHEITVRRRSRDS